MDADVRIASRNADAVPPRTVRRRRAAPQELIARARALIPSSPRAAPKADAERRLPQETIADMQAAGLFRVLQPKRWGGYEMDPATYFEIQLALGEGCMSTAWVYGVPGIHPWLLGLFDDRAAHEVWGEDDSTLICSSLMPAGKAAPAPGGFRLSGHWKFSSGSDHCGWAYLGAHVARRAARSIAASSWCRAATTRSSTPGTSRGSRPPAATTSWSRTRSCPPTGGCAGSTTSTASGPGRR